MSSWPRRPRLVAGNWKMNKTAREGALLARELVELLHARPHTEVAVCPPFTAIETVGAELRGSGVHLGGQNLHAEREGPFTGEISGMMLAAAGCRFVIVGHSERRHGMGEDDATVANKLRAARDRGVESGVGGRQSVLYGGSVNAGNAASLFSEDEIDGALVGGASLESGTFWKIIAAAAAGATAPAPPGAGRGPGL